MLKALRWPLLALLFSVILLAVALFISLSDSSDPQPETTPLVELTASPAPPSSTPPPRSTPIPVVNVANQVLEPVPAQLSEALVGNIQKLNPLFVNYNSVDRDIASLIFEGLTTINEYGEVIPDLAERWEVSQDGLEYVFLLRRDILWHDGIPFTSADVRYTIDTMRDPDFPGDKTLTAFWRTVEVTVIDEYTLRFRLVQPLASFPESLRIGILPLHVLEGYPVADLYRHPFNLTPIGTGPYQRENLYADEGQFAISLRVAPTYRQRPEGQTGYAIDRIVFRTYASVEEAVAAFARGEVNSIASLPIEHLASLSSLNHLASNTTLAPAVGVLIYNWNQAEMPYLQNQRVRIALAEGLNRTEAIQRTMAGQVMLANSPLLPGSWGYNPNVALPAYDPEHARSILSTVDFSATNADSTPTSSPAEEPPEDAEATVTEGENTPEDAAETPTEEATETPAAEVRRNFSILVLDHPDLVILAEDIAEQWNALGFNVTVEAVDEASRQQRLANGDFDTALLEYSFAPYADPDPYTFWHVSQGDDGLNYGKIQDFRISEVLESARRENFGPNRVTLYYEFQRLFAERVPALVLYYPLYAYITDDRLTGVQLGFISSPADRFRTIQKWNWRLTQS